MQYLCTMKPLKVVFFGTPEFAKTILKAINDSLHDVVGVVTPPDKASGRGQKLSESAVKTYAVEQNLPLFQPEKLKDPEFLASMSALGADLFVVVAFRMMPKVLFELPPLGTFNLHASLLPDYRGAAPINYAIMGGETTTGVTSFFINEKIDEGAILLQDSLEITSTDSAGSLHDKLMHLGATTVLKTLDGLSDQTLQPKPQIQVEQPKNAFKLFKDDMRINWIQPSKTIYDFIRGLSPYPCAFTSLKIGDEVKNLKLFEGSYSLEKTDAKPGTLFIDKNELKFYTLDGVYSPKTLQLEGKKRMELKDFLNGFRSFTEIEMA